jgi:hypothetical protein
VEHLVILKFKYKRAPAETTANRRDFTNNARSRLQTVRYSDSHVPNKIAISASPSGSMQKFLHETTS